MDVPCPIRWDACIWGLLTSWLKEQDLYYTKEAPKQRAEKTLPQGWKAGFKIQNISWVLAALFCVCSFKGRI